MSYNYRLFNEKDINEFLQKLFPVKAFSLEQINLTPYEKAEDRDVKNVFKARFTNSCDTVDVLKYFVKESNDNISQHFISSNFDDFMIKFQDEYKETPHKEIEIIFPTPAEAFAEFARLYSNEYGSLECSKFQLDEKVEPIMNSPEFLKAFKKLSKIENFEIKGISKKVICVPLKEIDKMSLDEIEKTIDLITVFEETDSNIKLKNPESRVEYIKAHYTKYIEKIYEIAKEEHFLDNEASFKEKTQELEKIKAIETKQFSHISSLHAEKDRLMTETPILKIFNEELENISELVTTLNSRRWKAFTENKDKILKAIEPNEKDTRNILNFFELAKEIVEAQQEFDKTKTEIATVSSQVEAFKNGINYETKKEIVEPIRRKLNDVFAYLSTMNSALNYEARLTKVNNIKQELANFVSHIEKGEQPNITPSIDNKVFGFKYYSNAVFEYNFYTALKKFVDSDFKDVESMKQMKENCKTIVECYGRTINGQTTYENFFTLKNEIDGFIGGRVLSPGVFSELSKKTPDKDVLASYILCDKIRIDDEHEKSGYDAHDTGYITAFTKESFFELIQASIKEANETIRPFEEKIYIDYNQNDVDKAKQTATKNVIEAAGSFEDFKKLRPFLETFCKYNSYNIEDFKRSFKEVETIENKNQEIEKNDDKVSTSTETNND